MPNAEATCIPSVEDFFDRFVTAFASFDAANVAELARLRGFAQECHGPSGRLPRLSPEFFEPLRYG